MGLRSPDGRRRRQVNAVGGSRILGLGEVVAGPGLEMPPIQKRPGEDSSVALPGHSRSLSEAIFGCHVIPLELVLC